MQSDFPSATIVISTKNRCADLVVALDSCLTQSSLCEVVVINDGSNDQTATTLSENYPSVVAVHHRDSTGYLVARNEGAKLSSGKFIFSIDDDAAFTSDEIVGQVVAEFNDPRIGAVAIPYVDVNRGPQLERQRAPDPAHPWITDRFIGTAHAVRKDIFLALGGYREFLFHQGEESDFCIRMLDAGYFVRLGNSDRINHFESPKRDTRRMDIYGRRNDVLFAVLNVPLVFLPLHLLSVIIKGILFGFSVGRPGRMIYGIGFGFVSAIRYFYLRKPVSIKTYLLFRRLRKHGPVRLHAVSS